MTERNPLVSIIVRTKDRPKLLNRALQSIGAQTYRPIEVVLVNDGGCDLDVDKFKSVLCDISLNYIKLAKNTGRAHAGNEGIGGASGGYVGFLDDDDEFHPDHLQTLVAFLEQSDYKVAYTDVEMIRCDFRPQDGTVTELDTTVFSKDFSYGSLFLGNYIPFNSVLFDEEVLRSAGGLDEDFELYEDWDLMIRVGHDNPFYHIRKVTARYYQWSGDLQINRADEWQMQSLHAKVIAKNLDKFTPSIIPRWKFERDRALAEAERAVRERDAHVKQLSDACREKDELIRSRDSLILERDAVIKTMQSANAELEVSLRKKTAQIECERFVNETALRLEREVKELEKINNEKEIKILELHRILAAMQGTLGWRVLETIRRVRDGMLPWGSRRRKGYDLLIKSPRVIKRDGVRTFLVKAERKLKGNNFVADDSRETVPSLSFTEDPGLKHFPSQRKFSVLFIKCEWAGITNHYRVENMAEYLKMKGTYAEILDLEDIHKNVPHVYTFDLVVIHRIPMNPVLREFIGVCKNCNIVVIFDIDDYLFEPSVIHLIEWVKHTDPGKQHELIEHMTECRHTLEACDYLFAPTDFLAKKGEELGKKAFVVRNGFSVELYGSFLEALKFKASKKNDILRIGYFSGTNTHQKDFEFVSGALLRILQEYNDVNLYICGLLELDSRFSIFSQRVERGPLVPLESLAEEVARCDINIAPLEPGNVFCEAKSELKYMYAGILKIPTVASPTDAFRYAIKDGENGFLAFTAEDWYEHIKELVEDSSLRREMGEKAYYHVMNTYSPQALGLAVQYTYGSVIADARVKHAIPEHSISIGIIVADFVDNFAAHSDLFEIADSFSERGHHVKFYFYGQKGNVSQTSLSSMRRQYDIVQGADNMLSADVLICTDPYNSSVSAYQQKDRAANLAYLPVRGKYEDIPHQWADLFQIIPAPSSSADVVNFVESLVWKTADLTRS